MARVQKDVVSYFPHDASACSGDTLTVLQSRFGNDGYAFWFKLLEKLAATEGHCLDCQNSNRWQLLLAKTGVNELTGVEIMDLLVEMKAIDKELWESHLIWCQNLVNNLAVVYRNRHRELPQKPLTTALNPITTGKEGITTPESTQSKVKKSKVDKSIYVLSEFPNIKISKEEHQKLIDKFGVTGTVDKIENLSLYIASKGDKYKSHYATILSWDKKDQKGGQSGKNQSGTNRTFPRDGYHERR